jgi:lipopolysaccharide/colanic/teichoic acid biosynthesis glycosyltransferase
MDFTILPKTTLRNRNFTRYAVKSYYDRPQTKAVEYNSNGFFYIGNDSANIEKMVKVFKRGYASQTPENAKLELKRCLERESDVIPEIIICEGHFDFSAIKNFYQFLNSHQLLSSIPFVLDATGMSEKELNHYRKNKLPDEIIFLEDHDSDSLMAKTQFFRKVKLRTNEMVIERNHIDLSMKAVTIRTHSLLKRTLDIAVASLALLLLSPLFLLIALAIRIESKGSVLYISKRAGKGYRIFDFYKFRTMRVGADTQMAQISHLNQYGADGGAGPVFFKINNDPRITRVGTFLRNSSLDELPQLLNVLLGDMSLVGNRPLPLYEAATLTTDQWAKRFMAPAGITGLWQITKRGKEDMSIEERINLDIDYADKNNFMYDLWIMANTPSALMQKSNA